MSTKEINNRVKELRELRRMADELADEIESIKDEIKQHMTIQGVDELIGIDYKITWKSVKSKRFDKATMINALGQDCYDKFCKVTTSRRFTLD